MKHDTQRAIIGEELHFLFEPNAQRFEQQLRAHLLDDGCNLPINIAKPRFYHLMFSALWQQLSPADYPRFLKAVPFWKSVEEIPTTLAVHQEFYYAMRFFVSHLNDGAKVVTSEIIDSIAILLQEWQLDESLFQENAAQFDARIASYSHQFTIDNSQLSIDNSQFNLIRRRLYMAWTTAMLRQINARQAFEAEFGSIPTLLNAMHADHAVFCRFMAFCKARTPYFLYIASRTFWRTLENLHLNLVKVSEPSQG